MLAHTDYFRIESDGGDGSRKLYMYCDFSQWESAATREHCKREMYFVQVELASILCSS